MKVETIEDEYVWNIPLEQNQRSQFLQSWWWGVFQQTFNRRAWRLQVTDKGKPLAAVQFLSHPLPGGRQYLYAPHGPVFFTRDIDLYETLVQDLYRAVEHAARDEKFIFCRIEPVVQDLNPNLLTPIGFRPVPSVQPQDELAAIVSHEEEFLLKMMHEKTRYNIRLAEKHDVRVRLIEDAGYARRVFPMFWAQLQATAKRQKIHLHEREYYARMMDLLMPRGLVKLIFAECDNTVIAAHLLSSFGDTIYFLHGGSDYNYRELMAPHLLHWEGMRLAKRLGKTYYNFGGVAPVGATTHPWLGLTRFKESFVKLGDTGERLIYPGGFDLAFQPTWYTMYTVTRRLRQVLR